VTQEQGLAFFPDGASFATAIGVEQNTLWLHDPSGERQITSQGYAYLPKLSADGKRLYYLLRSGVSTRTWVTGELWTSDTNGGQRRRLLPDLLLEDYDLSPDGKRVAFCPIRENGQRSLWIADIDGSSPPRQLADAPAVRGVFGPDGQLYFLEDLRLFRIRADGSGKQQVFSSPMAVIYDVSPDGKWVAAWTTGTSVAFYPLDGGTPVLLCSKCGTGGAENRGITPPVVRWSHDGRFLYIHTAWTTRDTYVIPLEPGRAFPSLPPAGIDLAEDLARLPGARRLEEPRAFAGPDPSAYMFMRATSQRNIYRVAVH